MVILKLPICIVCGLKKGKIAQCGTASGLKFWIHSKPRCWKYFLQFFPGNTRPLIVNYHPQPTYTYRDGGISYEELPIIEAINSKID